MQQHKNDLPNMEDFFNLSTYIPKFKRYIEIKTDLQRICTIYPNANYRCMCLYIGILLMCVCVLGICNKRMCCGMYTYNVMHTIYLCKL